MRFLSSCERGREGLERQVDKGHKVIAPAPRTKESADIGRCNHEEEAADSE